MQNPIKSTISHSKEGKIPTKLFMFILCEKLIFEKVWKVHFLKENTKKFGGGKNYKKLPHWNKAETGGNFVQIFASAQIFMYFLMKMDFNHLPILVNLVNVIYERPLSNSFLFLTLHFYVCNAKLLFLFALFMKCYV